MKMINIILYIWQLPQNILGIILKYYYKGYNYKILVKWGYLKYTVHYTISKKFPSGISLGNYVILKHDSALDFAHEAYGHCKQSIILGPLYLIVIGIFSAVHNLFHQWNIAKGDYYKYWCEKSADNLAEIKRDKNGKRYYL